MDILLGLGLNYLIIYCFYLEFVNEFLNMWLYNILNDEVLIIKRKCILRTLFVG